MNKIAIIIPTRGRPDKISSLLSNIEKTTTLPHETYFFVDPDDNATILACKGIKAKIVIKNEPSKYGPTINYALWHTTEPFLMLGADDIEFTKGWDKEMMSVMEDSKIGIVGHTDSWPISKTGHHGSHLLIRREYIKKFSGVEDEEGVIYSSKYYHYNTDIETEQTAMKRGAFAMSKAVIYHHHWCNNEAVKDETYTKAYNENMAHDNIVYNQRRKGFEQYLLEPLQQGKVVKANHGKLTVVVLSYCMRQYLQETIETLIVNTYNDFEFIIIDDGSDAGTVEYIRELNLGERIKIKKVLHPEHQYFTANINIGAKMATGEYVAFLNNDIRLSKHWDVYLMNALDKKNVWLANPYQIDSGCNVPYGKAERAGGIDIRGTCFMLKKETIKEISWSKENFLPPQFLLWFSDSWLARQIVKINKKKSVFVPEAVIFHYGSKSSQIDMDKGVFWWIVRGDAYAYNALTGQNVDHWLDICNAHLNFKT